MKTPKKFPTNKKEMIEYKKSHKSTLGKIKSLPGSLYNKFQSKKNKLGKVISNTKKAFNKGNGKAAFVTYPAGTKLNNGTTADGKTQYNDAVVKPATTPTTSNQSQKPRPNIDISGVTNKVLDGGRAQTNVSIGQAGIMDELARIRSVRALVSAAPIDPIAKIHILEYATWAEGHLNALLKATKSNTLGR